MQSEIYCTGEYLVNNPTYHVEDSAWKAQHILSMIHKHRLRPRSIIEIGCGAGEIIHQLQLQLPETECFGYDISPQAILLAKERENERLRFFSEDFLQTTVAQADLLLCIDVFEHVENYLSFLRNLRPRGEYKLFHIPLELTVQSAMRCRALLASRKGLGHLHYFMKETALATLTDTGYEIVDSTFTAPFLSQSKTFKMHVFSLPKLLFWLINKSLAARMFVGFSLLVLAK